MAVGTLQNRHTKLAPFEDDFNDGNYTGWSVWGGKWSASSYYARNTSGSTDRLVKAYTEPDYAMSFSYYREDSSNEILLYFRAGGDNASSGSYVQYMHDYLGTARHIHDGSKNVMGEYNYSPLGEHLHRSNSSITARFYGTYSRFSDKLLLRGASYFLRIYGKMAFARSDVFDRRREFVCLCAANSHSACRFSRDLGDSAFCL